MFKRKLRKSIASILTGATVLLTVNAFALVPTVARAASGDLVKSADSGTVYVVLADGESICSLVSEGHYDMWAQYKAKGVGRWQDISTVDTSTYTDSGVCSLRVGSLVRTAANPEVFVIQSGNAKRGFDAWATFVADGYGSGEVYFVTDAALAGYTTGTKITSATTAAEIREGQLVKYASSATVYYVAKEDSALVKREVTNEDAYFSNFGINWNLVITVPDTETYTTSASQITGADTAINRPVAITAPVTPVAGDIVVSLASDTPASATVPKSSLGVPFTKVLLTGNGTVSKIVATRKGLGNRTTAFDGVALYEGNSKLTLSRTITSTDTVTFNLTTPLTIVGNTPRTITIAADIATGSTAGDQHYFEISAAADITATGATVSGTFPIAGNTMSIGSVSVGQLKAEKETTSDTTVNVGEQKQEMGRFKLTAQTTASASSSEDIKVKALKLKQNGSANLTDLTNIKLYKDTVEMTGVTVATSSSYITFDGIDTTITKGNYARFVVKADVISGGGQTVILLIEEPSDVTSQGLTYGYGAYVHDGDTTWTEASVTGTTINLAAGELTFSSTNTAGKTITTKEDNVVVGEITIAAAEDSTISKIYGVIDGTDAGTANTNALDDTIENIRIQKADGSITYDATALTDDIDDNYEFYFGNVVVDQGSSQWKVLLNTIDAVTQSGDTYQLALNASGSSGTQDGETLTAVTAKNSQNKSITDIKPGAVMTGPVVTLSTASLTVTQITKDNTTVVGGTKGVVAIELQISAGTADEATITQMAFEDSTGNTADGTTETSNFSLYQNGVTNAIQSGVSPSSSTEDFTVTFNSINGGSGLKLAKGDTVKLTVKFDVNSPSTVTDGHLAILKATATDFGITARDSAGNDVASITDGNGTTNVGRTVTFAADGQLTTTKEDVLTDAQVLGGLTGVETLKLKFNADYEDVNLTSLTLDTTDAVGDSIENVYLYNGTTLVTTADFTPNTATAVFGDGTNSFFTVNKDDDAVLTVKVDLMPVGSGSDLYTADGGDVIVWTLDHDDATTPSMTAKGTSSGADISLSATYASSEILIGGDADITSNSYIVKRSLISTLTGANSSTDTGTLLATGITLKLFAFTITAAADSSGHNYDDAIDLRKLKLTVSGGGDLASTALSNVKIYRSDQPATKKNASTTDTSQLVFDETVSDLDGIANVMPGESKTFIVEATMPSATYTTADTLQISIADLGDSSSPTAVDFSDGHLIWTDKNTGTLVANDYTDWVGYSGITITDVRGPLFTGPQQ